MKPSEWGSLLHLKPGDFKNPEKLDVSIVRALDLFIGRIGARPIIISDYRSTGTGQHPLGRAIDTTWPGLDGQEINTKALASGLFSGIGVYVNETGEISHHFDSRTDRTPQNPATWGGIITHPYDPGSEEHVRRTEYVAMATVLDIIKKKGSALIIFLILSGWILWKLSEKT
jgi:hypothetical protein